MAFTNFNNPTGTQDQQDCENICGHYDVETDNPEVSPNPATKRQNRAGIAVDIKYQMELNELSVNTAVLKQWLGKCGNCPEWLAFKAEQEA